MSKYEKPPIRNGEIYCSPWCGGGCKYSDYEKATKDANMVANELGDGWVPHVWENLGWKYKVVNGECNIHLNKTGKCWGDIMLNGIQIWADGYTPRGVLENLKIKVDDYVATVNDFREIVERLSP